MRFVVRGADRDTGEDRAVIIDADSEEAARRHANGNGLFVSSCDAMPLPPPDSTQIRQAKAVPRGKKPAPNVGEVISACAGLVLLGWIFFHQWRATIAADPNAPSRFVTPSYSDSPEVAAFKKIAATFESKELPYMSNNDQERLTEMIRQFGDMPFDGSKETNDARQMLEEWHDHLEGRFTGHSYEMLEADMDQIDTEYKQRNN